jgi:hypothetical protein
VVDVLTRGCRLSLRFAKPSAAIAGASTQTTPDDADVDPAHFTVVTQEVAQSGTRVGTSAANSPQVMSVLSRVEDGVLVLFLHA